MAHLSRRFRRLTIASAVVWLCATSSFAAAKADAAPFRSMVGLGCSSRAECGFLPGLACVHGVCDYCLADGDCSGPGEVIRRCNKVEVVNAETLKLEPLSATNALGNEVTAAYCVEKDLFYPFTWGDVLTTLLAFLATALGSGCGVGGGGILVPAFILVIGLSPKHAIPLSKASIFGNAAATYLFTFRRKHPIKKNMPVINYDVASIMEPTTLIGSVAGVMLNHLLPNWLILVLLVSLLSYTTHKTYLKGTKIRAKETLRKQAILKSVLRGSKTDGSKWSIFQQIDWKIAARKWLAITRRNRKLRALLKADQEDFETLPPLHTERPQSAMTLLDKKPGEGETDKKQIQKQSVDEDTAAEIRGILERRDADVFPLRVVLPLLVAWLVIFLQALLRGGHGAPSVIGVQCSSFEYWFLTLLPVVVLLVIAWRVGYRLRLENRLRVVSGFEFLESDIHWTKENATVFPLYCISAGVAAGLLGIGGGMVKGPIMLEMGVLPPVQTATASYMILYTASSTTLQFAIAGQFPGTLQYDYVAWFAFVGFLGGLCGQKVVAYLVKKYKRESIMVFILAGTIGISTLAMGFIGHRSTLHDLQTGGHMGLSSLCGNE